MRYVRYYSGMDRRWLLTLLVGGLLACGDPSGIGDVTGTFNLAAVDATPPPAFLGADLNCDMVADGGLLNLSRGSYDLAISVLQDCSRTGGDTTPAVYLLEGVTRTAGDTLFLTDSTGVQPVLRALRDGNGVVLRFADSTAIFLAPHSYHFTPQPLIGRR